MCELLSLDYRISVVSHCWVFLVSRKNSYTRYVAGIPFFSRNLILFFFCCCCIVYSNHFSSGSKDQRRTIDFCHFTHPSHLFRSFRRDERMAPFARPGTYTLAYFYHMRLHTATALLCSFYLFFLSCVHTAATRFPMAVAHTKLPSLSNNARALALSFFPLALAC